MKENKIVWKGANNHLFELDILDYQFPEITEEHDANWIILDVKATNELGTWHRQCACTFTWEIKYFSRWLEMVTQGFNKEYTMDSYEPGLSIKYIQKIENNYLFEISLKSGFSFYDMYHPLEFKYCIILVEIDNNLLNKAIRSFNIWNRLFPPRGDLGKKMEKYYPDYLK